MVNCLSLQKKKYKKEEAPLLSDLTQECDRLDGETVTTNSQPVIRGANRGAVFKNIQHTKVLVRLPPGVCTNNIQGHKISVVLVVEPSVRGGTFFLLFFLSRPL